MDKVEIEKLVRGDLADRFIVYDKASHTEDTEELRDMVKVLFKVLEEERNRSDRLYNALDNVRGNIFQTIKLEGRRA